MTPKRFGRPPVPPGKSRPHRLVTFVRSEELEQIRKLAEERQASISKVCHSLIRSALEHGHTTDESE